MKELIDDIEVTYLDHMGSDLTVVNAARVSFNVQTLQMRDRDVRLLHYLAENGHWSPFAHPQLSLRVKAPIFVARQLAKHQVGLAWNEVSRRYIDTDPTFYVPEVRRFAENVKQGSSDEIVEGADETIKKVVSVAYSAYKSLLDEGVAPEIARVVLPQAMMTEWVWTGSLYAFARVCNLRLDEHAQKESRIVAKEIYRHLVRLFPRSTEALVKKVEKSVDK